MNFGNVDFENVSKEELCGMAEGLDEDQKIELSGEIIKQAYIHDPTGRAICDVFFMILGSCRSNKLACLMLLEGLRSVKDLTDSIVKASKAEEN